MSSPPFFRFPHTPHLAWLGSGEVRGDKVFAPAEAAAFLDGPVTVEEKVDGANLGLSLGPEGIRVQNRGQFLDARPSGQFSRLLQWLAPREDALAAFLGEDQILFGEWCAARHSLDYPHLPDWFLAFDVYDTAAQSFWSTPRRDQLCREIGLATVPALDHGHFTLSSLCESLRSSARSHLRAGPPEGWILRRESDRWLERRAKLVRPEFVQTIDEHWRHRPIEWNHLTPTPAFPHE